jgi:hypothetical protein
MPQVGFKSTIPVFEGAKTFHALDRSATVTDRVHWNKQISPSIFVS